MFWREQRNEAAQLGMQPTATRAMMSAAAADARRWTDRMKIDTATCSPGSGNLRMKCSGRFGIGTGGNCSAEALTTTIEQWITDHPEEPVTEVEIDYTKVDYSWGDGPVSSMVPLLRHGVGRFRLIGSSSNCDSLQSLLEACNLPWFELLRIDEMGSEPVLTPVPLKLRIRTPLDETKLSTLAQHFAARLFEAAPELKNHALMITRSSEQCCFLIDAKSPTGDAGRRLEISMDVDDQEPAVSFGHVTLPALGVATMISLIEAIVRDRLAMIIYIGGQRDGYDDLLDLSDPDAIGRELRGALAPWQVRILSWGGSADCIVSLDDYESRDFSGKST
jgi:hypothetical protein